MKYKIISILLLTSLAFIALGPIQRTQAAALSNMSDTLSTLKKSTAANHTIKFRTPTGVESDTDTITITFPSDFDVSTIVFGDVDFSHGSSTGAETEETLAATAASGAWGAAVAGRILTLTAPTNATTGEVTANDYCIVEIGTNATSPGAGTHQIVNPTAAASNVRITIAGTFGDTGTIAIAILDDDQIVISGSTDSTISFSLSANTVALGTLSTLAIATGTATLVAATNALTGYEIKYYGDTLTSGGNTITSIGAGGAASDPGNEQFGMKISASGGEGASVSPYDSTDYALNAASTALAMVKVAESTIASNDTTYTLTYGANISSITEPGDYSTTHTWICTGNF